jgi:hypothetical protein
MGYISMSSKSKYCSVECVYIEKRRKLLLDRKINPIKYEEQKNRYNYNRRKIKIKGVRNCCICGNEFILTTRNKKYCSADCYKKADLINLRKRMCDSDYRAHKNEIWRVNYAKNNGYISKIEVECIFCSEKFIRKSVRQKICSKEECKLKWLSDKKMKRYYNGGREKILLQRKNNIDFRIKHNLRTRIRQMLQYKRVKKSYHTMDLIGCSIEELKQYLEKKFIEGMNWDNYGLRGWHIDHIIPLSKFNLMDVNEQKKSFRYSNMQPLWARDNHKKSDKCENI